MTATLLTVSIVVFINLDIVTGRYAFRTLLWTKTLQWNYAIMRAHNFAHNWESGA